MNEHSPLRTLFYKKYVHVSVALKQNKNGENIRISEKKRKERKGAEP